MDWYSEKKTTDQYAEEKRWVFSFDLKEASENECLTEREEGSSRTRVQYIERISPPGSLNMKHNRLLGTGMVVFYDIIINMTYLGLRCCFKLTIVCLFFATGVHV